MADYSYKETSNRHLRFKLQSLSRRLDELEEATKNLQKAEDELLELQDKVIQAEGSNSSMLADVEALRKRVLKIEGKDEEIRKAEELCQLMKEKLEEEESLTRELKTEIERLQKRMAELEKLEEAFGRSKNDCTQLCLSLNEEKNLTKKISTELEVLRAKVKELEQSEDRLDKTEQSLVSELEKLKSLALVFVSERKHFTEKEKQNEKLIQELTQKLEQNNKLNRVDQTRNTSNLLERSSNSILERNDMRIEVDLTTSALSSKETRRKGSLDYLKLVENETRNKSENQKNKNQEDNKVKDLNQEIEKLKIQIKHFASLEEELKALRAKNNDLHDSYLSEQNKNKLLLGQLEEIKMQMIKQKELENGEAETEEINVPSRIKHDRPKHRAVTAESAVSKAKSRELSPQHRRDRIRNREFSFNNEGSGQGSKQVTSSNLNSRRTPKASSTSALLDRLATDSKRGEDRSTLDRAHIPSPKDSGIPPAEVKKSREQPSVLSRYPPAAQEHKAWKASSKPKNDSSLRGKIEKTSQLLNDTYHCKSVESEDKSSKAETTLLSSEKGIKAHLAELPESRASKMNCGSSSGFASSYRHHLSAEMLAAESTGSKMETSASISSHRQHLEDSPVKIANSPEKEPADASPDIPKPVPLAKSWLISRSQEDLLQSHPPIPRKEEMDQISVVSSNVGGLKPTSARAKVSNPGSHDKFSTAEEASKATTTPTSFDLGAKKEPVSREFTSPRGAIWTSPFENGKSSCNEEEFGRSARTNATGAAKGLKSRRQFGPREALRSKVIIKPAIVEKDVKEIMGGSGPGLEVSSEKQHPVVKTVSHKMTSSITIYPSEPVTQRTNTSEATKEQQHLSPSNTRVIPNELSAGANAASTSYEITISKSNVSLKVPETDKNGDAVLRSTVETVVSKSSIMIKPSESIEKNSEPPMETINWKSHGSSEENSPEMKHVTVRSAWQTRQGLQSSKDSATKMDENMASRNPYRSSTEPAKLEGTSARIYAIEQNSRRASASVNSWNTPETDSRRTKSSLSVSEIPRQKSDVCEPPATAAWNCTVLPDENKDFVPSSRRKPFGSTEQLAWAETPRKRPNARLEMHRQLPGSKDEERRYWSKGYSEDN